MKITALAENTSARHDLGSEHGLSLFIENSRCCIVTAFTDMKSSMSSNWSLIKTQVIYRTVNSII